MSKKTDRIAQQMAPGGAALLQHIGDHPPADMPEPIARVLGWIKRKHEPSEAEIFEVVLALYAPITHTLRAILQLQSEIKEMVSKFASVTDALTGLTADVAAEKTVVASAVTLITGIPGLIQAAIATALAAGATPDQLQSFSDLSDQIEGDSTGLQGAVTANTPTPVTGTGTDPGTGTGGTPPDSGTGTDPGAGTGTGTDPGTGDTSGTGAAAAAPAAAVAQAQGVKSTRPGAKG